MGVSTSTPVAFNYDQQLLADTKVQSVEADVPEVKGETKPRRHPAVKDKLVVEAYVDEKTGEGCKTVWDCFQRGVKLNAAGPFLGTRVYEVDEKNAVIFDKDKTPRRGDYTWVTYEQVDREVRDFGAGLTVLGARAGDNIGIFANNRAEWVQGALAFYSQNMRTVSLYATLGEDAVEYIINHAEIKICLVSQENMNNLLKSLGKIHLTHIIQFDPDARYKNFNETISEEHRKKAAEHNVQILGFTEVQKLAEGKGIFPNPPKAEDLAMVMYTSGTTGNPKGALLTHRNIVAAVAASPYIVQMNKDDRHISYLPLAHIFETIIQVSAYAMGAQVGFFQNNVKKLTADFQALKPTLLCGVPRVFSRIYQTVFAGVSAKNCVVKWYFNKAYQYQCEQLRLGRPRDAKYDAKVFIPLRERVGLDKCRIIITGAAPCPPYLIEFLKVVIGAAVVQGYGLTETCAGGTITRTDDITVGHTGPPTPCCEVKLVDIPDMEYLSTDKPYPRGEILIRGANVFQGYYKDEKSTEGALKDGWLCTGDVGRWNPNGTLSIIDRKKNMFKLSQGEYIAAEKIETTYGKAPVVGQIFVYGNSFKSTLIGVVVPAMEPTFNFFVEKGWWPTPKDQTTLGSEEFIANFEKVGAEHAAELKAWVWASLREQEKPLKGFEKLAELVIETRIDKTGAGFTEANGCMTPTFKLRRPYLLKRYLVQLKEAYGRIGEPVAADEKWPGEE